MSEEPKHWYGVDLDATLAVYRGWKGPKHIGKPIPKMVARVKRWLREGKTVKIFTARVAGDNGVARRAIQKYCKKVFGQVLPITNRKDQYCKQIWDDRAHNMKANTGEQMNKAAFLQAYIDKCGEGPTASEVSFKLSGDSGILKMLNYIGRIGGFGHSFDIVVDPDSSEYKKSFGFDGRFGQN